MTNGDVRREMIGRACAPLPPPSRRDTTQRNATGRCAPSGGPGVARIDSGLHLPVSVVCTRYSTREPGIIFVKPLSAADRVRCAAMNRAFIPTNRVSPRCASRIQFDSATPLALPLSPPGALAVLNILFYLSA